MTDNDIFSSRAIVRLVEACGGVHDGTTDFKNITYIRNHLQGGDQQETFWGMIRLLAARKRGGTLSQEQLCAQLKQKLQGLRQTYARRLAPVL